MNNSKVKNKHKQIDNGEDLYCIEFSAKPFGITFGTDPQENKKKNIYVMEIEEKSVASQTNLIIGSKIVKFEDEMVEGRGATKIYKIFKNKYEKQLPLKITFRKPVMDDDDIDVDEKEHNNDDMPAYNPPIIDRLSSIVVLMEREKSDMFDLIGGQIIQSQNNYQVTVSPPDMDKLTSLDPLNRIDSTPL
eukprot:5032_1